MQARLAAEAAAAELRAARRAAEDERTTARRAVLELSGGKSPFTYYTESGSSPRLKVSSEQVRKWRMRMHARTLSCAITYLFPCVPPAQGGGFHDTCGSSDADHDATPAGPQPGHGAHHPHAARLGAGGLGQEAWAPTIAVRADGCIVAYFENSEIRVV